MANGRVTDCWHDLRASSLPRKALFKYNHGHLVALTQRQFTNAHKKIRRLQCMPALMSMTLRPNRHLGDA